MAFADPGAARPAAHFAVFLLMVAFVAATPAVAQYSGGSCGVQGTLRDSQGRPVAGASVFLQAAGVASTASTHTDAQGKFGFSGIAAASYTVSAEMAGGRAKKSFTLRPGENKRVDLALGAEKGAADAPQFFDEPQFTVAGVTDPANAGGHGSDTILRSTEAMAKETVALKTPGSGNAAGKAEEKTLRDAADRDPQNFDADLRIGKLLREQGESSEALPYLERASKLHPGDCDSGYELTLAYAAAGKYEQARSKARALLERRDLSHDDQAGLHHVLADASERLNDPLEAVREYQRAAELLPVETNLFDWGAELLLHNALEPAVEVFSRGHAMFPRSTRMLIGLGVAEFARGSYEQAAEHVCAASDLTPEDAAPYLFLGRMQSVEGAQSPAVTERLARFAHLQAENALANYYYALSLWQRREGGEASGGQVESLLQKSVRLDPKLGLAYLQLGILYAEHRDFSAAIASYLKAIDAAPSLEQAHFRLAQAYQRMGKTSEAEKELAIYRQMSKQTSDEVERQRHEIRQFVYTLRGTPPTPAR